MSRLNQIRFALFLILCAAIFAFQAKRVIDLERPTAKPATVSFDVNSIVPAWNDHLWIYMTVPEDSAAKMNIPKAYIVNSYLDLVRLKIPASKYTGTQSVYDGKFRCEMLLYPTGAAKFSRLVPVSAE